MSCAHSWITVTSVLHSELQFTVHTTPRPSQPARPHNHNKRSFPFFVDCSRIQICVWSGLTLFIACLSPLRSGIAEVNPLLPGNQVKQWSQWDIARLMDSPPPLPHLRFSCAEVFIESWWRRPCMTLIHLNGRANPLQKTTLSHTCRVSRKQFRRAVLNQQFYLEMVQTFVYHLNVSLYFFGGVLYIYLTVMNIYSSLLSPTESLFFFTLVAALN